jgi:crotonobetainyl-CoA:carnitine CoA-transferase CaiB-like acyl-CoA transferase
VKVEPPGGENLRYRSENKEPPEFQFLNPSKQGIVLDLKTDDGKQALEDLVEKSDVLIENFSPGTMESLGLSYEQLREINPELVYGHGTGFGETGPYQDYPAMDLTIQSISGAMHTTGFPDNPPVKAGPAIADFMGGIHLAAGILSALYQREQTGEGEYVEVGMFDCIYPTLASPISAWARDDGTPPRTGNQHSGLAIVPYNVYNASDGYVTIICMEEGQWERLAKVMDKEHLLEDERFSSKAKRAEHADEVDNIIQSWLDDKKKDQTVDLLLDADIPAAPVQTINEVVEDDHLRERGMLNYFPTRQQDGREELPVPGSPIKLAGSDDPEVTNAPQLGEDTEEVLSEVLGYSAQEIDAVFAQDTATDR